MVKFRLTKWVGDLLLWINVGVVALMVATGYSYLIDPSKASFFATWGMIFPFFLIVNLIFLIFWLIFKPFKALLSFLALVVCYFPVRMYIGINPSSSDIPEDAIKVMSYNVLNFSGMPDNKLSRDTNQLVYYLVDADCDILCLQEANDKSLTERMRQKLQSKYPYHEHSDRDSKSTYLSIYSKYPVTKVDTIPYESQHNLSLAYTLSTPKGDILVVNNHLESNKLSPEEKEKFKSMMTGDMDRDSARAETKTLYTKLTETAVIRNGQAKAVAEYVAMHKDVPIILCGDFNETPVSYNHHIIEKQLTDCFMHKGMGFGWSYCHSGLRVRIDNIMCSDHFTPHKCKVLSDVDYSDHYPIVCWLSFNEKEAGN